MANSGKNGLFTTEIRQLMHVFGDDSVPAVKSSSFVEQQIHCLMYNFVKLLSEIASKRANGNFIQIQDIFAILLKSPFSGKKISRLIYCFRHMDAASNLKNQTRIDPLDCKSKEMSAKILKLYKILVHNDETRLEYESFFDTDFVDEITQARHQVLAKRTEKMEPRQYKAFSACRAANFRREWPKNFRQWIQSSPTAIDCDNNNCQVLNISTTALEALHHIAMESVALLVENASEHKLESQKFHSKMLSFGLDDDPRLSSILGCLQNNSTESTTKFIETRFYGQTLSKLTNGQKALFYLYL